MLRSKLFAFIALLGFSFGIASTTTLFSILDAVLLHPPTFTSPEEMVEIEAAYDKQEWDNVPPALLEILPGKKNLFSRVTAIRPAIFTVMRVPVPDQVFDASVSGNFFDLMPARPLMRRILSPTSQRPA